MSKLYYYLSEIMHDYNWGRKSLYKWEDLCGFTAYISLLKEQCSAGCTLKDLLEKNDEFRWHNRYSFGLLLMISALYRWPAPRFPAIPKVAHRPKVDTESQHRCVGRSHQNCTMTKIKDRCHVMITSCWVTDQSFPVFTHGVRNVVKSWPQRSPP